MVFSNLIAFAFCDKNPKYFMQKNHRRIVLRRRSDALKNTKRTIF